MVDEVAEVSRAIDHGWGAGSVIGAIPRRQTDCEIELVLVRRVDGGSFVMRHLSMSLKQVARNREHLFISGDTPKWPHTDHRAVSIVDAAALAAAFRSRSVAQPLPAVQQWAPLGGPFEKQLERFHLQAQVPWLHPPPFWRCAGKQALSAAGAAVTLFLFVLGAGSEVLRGEDSPSTLEMALAGLLIVGLLGALSLVVLMVNLMKEQHKPKSDPRHSAKEPPVASS